MRFRDGLLPAIDSARRMSEDLDSDGRRGSVDSGDLSEEIRKAAEEYGLESSDSDEEDSVSTPTSGSASPSAPKKKTKGKKTGIKKKRVSKISMEVGGAPVGEEPDKKKKRTKKTGKSGDGIALPPPLTARDESPTPSGDDPSLDAPTKRRSLTRVKSVGAKSSSAIKRPGSSANLLLPPPPTLALPPVGGPDAPLTPPPLTAPPSVSLPPPPPPLDAATPSGSTPKLPPPPIPSIQAEGDDGASLSPSLSQKRDEFKKAKSTSNIKQGLKPRGAKPTEGPEGNPNKNLRLLDGAIRLSREMYNDPDAVDPIVFAFDAPETEINAIYLDETNVEDFTKEFPSVKSATLEKCIVNLTSETFYDPDFSFAFLLNYSTVTTYVRLLELLTIRWRIPIPQRGVEQDQFLNKKLKPIRLRVFNVIKTWLEDHYRDFENNAALSHSVDAFIKEVVTKDMAAASNNLSKLLSGISEKNNSFGALQFDQKPPRPFLPTNVRGKLSILDLHPEEMARQITLIDHSLLKAIKPGEFLGLGWMKADKDQRSPHILAMIANFNRVSHWAASEILTQPDVKLRAQVIVRFICIAHFCLQLNNFNGVMQMLAALQNSSVHRLYKTWELLPQKFFDMFEAMALLMNGNAGQGNFRQYRDTLKMCVPPCVPYLGVYLTDLTFLNEGNPDFLDPEKTMINVQKMMKISRVVRSITMFQQTPYCLAPVDFMKDFIMASHTLTEQEQYNKSIDMEPKLNRQEKAALASKDAKKKIKPIEVDLKALNLEEDVPKKK
jgi:hypothetical protein